MRLTLAIIFAFAVSSLFAQSPTQTVRGKVVDNQTKSGLPGVIVLLVDTGKVSQNTATDVDGNFRLEQVPVGRHMLTFKMTGYKESTIPIIVTSGKEVVLTIEMEESVVD